MKCSQCAVSYIDVDETDYVDGVFTCSECSLQGDCFCITYEGREVMVMAQGVIEAVQKWNEYNERKTNVKYVSIEQLEIRKVEHAIISH